MKVATDTNVTVQPQDGVLERFVFLEATKD
jgi:hypothetical protein